MTLNRTISSKHRKRCVSVWRGHLRASTKLSSNCSCAKQRISSTHLCSQKQHFGLQTLSKHLINAKQLRPTIGGTFPITMSRMPSAVSTLDQTTTTLTLQRQQKVSACCSLALQNKQLNLLPKWFHPCPKTMLGKEVAVQHMETVPRLLQISPRWRLTVVILCPTNQTAVFQGFVPHQRF